ncbi:uncharacterized protein LOC135922916 isoform X2 [Gordionus sp. m RMFG-2023]|uniref:uncharacterized protein LOC135922916 isoform X2 n=1 Tax=Gordionus sp. m RMFG-2023 TaxID=3053472 RepID=UPI0031FD0BAD
MSQDRLLEKINKYLPESWTAFLTPFGRVYYYNSINNATYWYPPESYWSRYSSLPYGWETAVDNFGKCYYINHINHTTSYNDPREDFEPGEETIKPRDIELVRDSDLGFGFIAGSEKPVIVRFVMEDGPSYNKLQAGDQIIRVNGEYVEQAPREHVIELIKNCKDKVLLTVCQQNPDNSNRKSALLSASKKAKLKNKPSRVRFSERITVNGHPMTGATNQPYESCVHAMANILKVYLENGQTKSFKYDNKTTVRDVLDILKEKLNLLSMDYFCLVLQHIDDVKCTRLTLLYEDDLLSKIALRPGSQYYRCLFRVIYAPKNPDDMYEKDKAALNYFYLQCFNDILHRRFRNTIKTDLILKLASLSIYLRCQQSGVTKLLSSKLSGKKLEQELQLKKFVPEAVFSSMRSKDVLKKITSFLKKNINSFKASSEDEIKLQYLKMICSDILLYGAQCYSATLIEKNLDIGIIISPKLGLKYYNDFIEPDSLIPLANFEDIQNIHIIRDNDVLQTLEIKCSDKVIKLKINVDEAEDMILLIQGYYKLFQYKSLPVEITYINENDHEAPPYYGKHIVKTSGWNYPNLLFAQHPDMEHIIDLSSSPPYFDGDTFKTFNNRSTQTSGRRSQSNVIIQYSEIFSDLTGSPENFNYLPKSNGIPNKSSSFKPDMKSQESMTDIAEKMEIDDRLGYAENGISDIDKLSYYPLMNKDSSMLLNNTIDKLENIPGSLISKPSGKSDSSRGNETDSESIFTSPEPSPRHRLNLPIVPMSDFHPTNTRNLLQIPENFKEPSFALLSPDKITPIMNFYESQSLLEELQKCSIDNKLNQSFINISNKRNSNGDNVSNLKLDYKNSVDDIYDLNHHYHNKTVKLNHDNDNYFNGNGSMILEDANNTDNNLSFNNHNESHTKSDFLRLMLQNIKTPDNTINSNKNFTNTEKYDDNYNNYYQNYFSPHPNSVIFSMMNDIDIIDLTMIPTPKTPDQEKLLEFPNFGYMPPPGYICQDNLLAAYQQNNYKVANGLIPQLHRSFSDSIITLFEYKDEIEDPYGANIGGLDSNLSQGNKKSFSLDNVYYIKSLDTPLYINQ